MPYDLPVRRLQWRLTLWGIIVLFPIALVIFALSRCEVRKRSEKRDCKAGKVAQCEYVGKYYEAKGSGLISFLMSYNDDAVAYYTRACKLKSSLGCERMVHLLNHGAGQAKNLSTDQTDMADGLIESCADQVAGACDELETFFDQGDWVLVRAARAFDKLCAAGKPEACYRIGSLQLHGLGGLDKDVAKAAAFYEKACAAHIGNSCELVQAFHEAQAGAGSGSGDGSDTGSAGSGTGSATGSASPPG